MVYNKMQKQDKMKSHLATVLLVLGAVLLLQAPLGIHGASDVDTGPVIGIDLGTTYSW